MAGQGTTEDCGRCEIRNPKSEARNKSKIQMFKCPKQLDTKKMVLNAMFGSFEFGEFENCFGFLYSDFGFILHRALCGSVSCPS